MTVHVSPRNDLVEHEVEDCVCGPHIAEVKLDDGDCWFIVIHHALDSTIFKDDYKIDNDDE
jgi:hypothetical protein